MYFVPKKDPFYFIKIPSLTKNSKKKRDRYPLNRIFHSSNKFKGVSRALFLIRA